MPVNPRPGWPLTTALAGHGGLRRSEQGRELPHLAGPQPVGLGDFTHVDLGRRNAVPRKQIDKFAAHSLDVG